MDREAPGAGAEPATIGDVIDGASYRRTVGLFCTGVTIVATMNQERLPVGFSCQSFVSVSLDPPLVSFSVACSSRSWPHIERAGVFCVNILSVEQEALCRTFTDRRADRFAGVGWSPGPVTGSPRLAGSLGFVECTVEAVHPAGDHMIVIGRVRQLECAAGNADPLLFYSSQFRRPSAVLQAEQGGHP
jgi:3-hydroxy-9,10-secoandrosta-1,3,5(10)-triene-9,17-dione monooxygenase reductase component